MALPARGGMDHRTLEALERVRAANAMQEDWPTEMGSYEWGLFWPEFPPMAWFWYSLQPGLVQVVWILVPALLCCMFCYSPLCFQRLSTLSRLRKCQEQSSSVGHFVVVPDLGETNSDPQKAEASRSGLSRNAFCCRLLVKSLIIVFLVTCLGVHLLTLDGFTYLFEEPMQHDDSQVVDVFLAREHGYYCLKIPSLIHLQDGVLLAFVEARVSSCSDYAWTDLVMKRSVDNGKTWSQIQVVRAEGRSWSMSAVGNAAPVQIRSSGRVLLPHTVNNSEVWLTHSDDSGLTWSAPALLSGMVAPEWRFVGLGPPGSVQLSSGRVLIPAYHSKFRSNSGNLLSHLHTVYSDDEGATWRRGASLPFGETNLLMNEAQAVELRNGSVLFLSRAGVAVWEVRGHLAARSDDAGDTLTAPRELDGLRQPFDGCQGSLARAPDGALLWVSPAPRSVNRLFRRMLTVFESRDEGTSWRELALINAGGSGYSSLVSLGASMGLLYERSNVTEFVFKPTSIVFLELALGKIADQSFP